MSSKLNHEFEMKVKMIAEEFGYSLEATFTNDKDVKFNSKDKKAYIVPVSYLNNAEYKKVREEVMPYAVIMLSDSVENSKSDYAVVFFDETQSYKGTVKMIDFPFKYEESIPCIANLFCHDAYPGDERLIYDVNDGYMDDMSDHWDDYVKIVSFSILENNHYSWHPSDYCYTLPKREGFELKELGDFLGGSIHTSLGDNNVFKKIFKSEINKKGAFEGRTVLLQDLKSSQVDYKLDVDDIPERQGEGEYYEITDSEAIVVSLSGALRPTLIDAKESTVYVPLSEMAVIDLSKKSEFDAEYLVKELQKDYVAKQVEDKQRSVMDNRDYILDLIKVYIPSDIGGLSSIERQRICVQQEQSKYIKYLEYELEKERLRYLKNYKDILGYCQEESLKRLLIKLEKNEISDDYTIFNEVRKLIEWVKLKSPGHLSKYKNNKYFTEYSTNIDKDLNIPEYIARSFHICVSLGNEASHFDDPRKRKKVAPPITRPVKEGKAPYATKSVIYSLLNILYWCKDLEDNINV
ncbi:MAG: hypothetical protein J1E37_06005 [Prevotella sp.]|nr:hypothetical protein [Prevotella sp.]